MPGSRLDTCACYMGTTHSWREKQSPMQTQAAVVDTDHRPHLPFLQLLVSPDIFQAHQPAAHQPAAPDPVRAEGFPARVLLKLQPISDQKLGPALDSEMSGQSISNASLALSDQPSLEAQEWEVTAKIFPEQRA